MSSQAFALCRKRFFHCLSQLRCTIFQNLTACGSVGPRRSSGNPGSLPSWDGHCSQWLPQDHRWGPLPSEPKTMPRFEPNLSLTSAWPQPKLSPGSKVRLQ
ncbi:uncharacterized protein GVI51_M00693 [Nakaseomyces glabratus]|uniref:Uncharacterized protein n=1 Tax=Candida glabrata (strain ATCC 2001 / BCRC 20586 / JCM 3761 / NBRC 0622 / NRRL Y-65 / CBS 138) TaxID=284593 RepID=Q6FK64_CANGA|nr:uncharacterized protein CAGL0M00792g [Nakaseomyces glabratus]KAH7593560.1 hypothetical protein J7294_04705 [Nakaseomyces glabratus]KAH7600011.1 hypothetical protein J7293_04697 [Nakaseomyces glabratus]QHS69060.1 uncharacterized protein GVI51_M00693 [Nakaseomyces glabratus]CAG62356.1 unnamed protein product [Nakaseomyces glabratus]|eukprot:XP_449380.1 uncharacterized protein CAGL0M00792g [[Candida] glabrata]